ncbi:PDZ domain-containing protein [Mycetocola spongiae]|nr:PDZ domain-containing protein [Mycetocola spongiae]
MLLLLAMALWPSNYLVQQPGPVANTIGTTTVDKKEVPVIEINGAETFDTEGALDLLTVQILGDRERPANWLSVAAAWFDPSRTVVPIDSVYAPGMTSGQREEQNKQLMVSSQQDAVAAALLHLGYSVPAKLRITTIQEGSPADGPLVIGDEVIAINGEAMSDLEAVRAAVKNNAGTEPLSIDVIRDGEPLTVSATPVKVSEPGGATRYMLGIGTGEVFEFPFDVKIHLEDIGGPSAGMMFALGIIDKLTPGNLNGGKNIAGTGTITSAGTVGAIGGVRQKLFAAKDAGAEYFLAPESNCDEVIGHIPGDLQVFAVKTLDDSLAVLQAVRDGGDMTGLPTCSADASGK